MLILHDPQCADFGSAARPEQPARVTKTAAHLRLKHPDWIQRTPTFPGQEIPFSFAHTASHLNRLRQPRDFDGDTPYFDAIAEHAVRAVGAALEAVRYALSERRPVFSLMRPPGHHATADQAMGFCYLNQVAVAALAAHYRFGAARVAVWDFDAHHGNGTEGTLQAHVSAYNDPASVPFFFASVHQSPGYPGTGQRDLSPFVRNWPIKPNSPRTTHMVALRASLDAVLEFQPDVILVSAGFDAYARDPLTEMTLEQEDFATLGRWLRQSGRPAAAVLEGGYSPDLPLLIDAFLTAWENDENPA
jgi:acetoin utilization deacetylase AcuC-like enzyme